MRQPCGRIGCCRGTLQADGAPRGLGARGGAAGLASYMLLFEPDFVQSLGEHDAYARKAELLAFFGEGAA
jgi:hypothetical protein